MNGILIKAVSPETDMVKVSPIIVTQITVIHLPKLF